MSDSTNTPASVPPVSAPPSNPAKFTQIHAAVKGDQLTVLLSGKSADVWRKDFPAKLGEQIYLWGLRKVHDGEELTVEAVETFAANPPPEPEKTPAQIAAEAPTVTK